MFEANHQCISTRKIFSKEGKILEDVEKNNIANFRCDPYSFYFKIKQLCEKENVAKISWTFDHSINGHPYERIVDTENACLLKYKPFSHNDWIKMDGESEKLDIPVYKNGFGRDIQNNVKIISEPYKNETLLNIMTKFYWILWFSILAFCILMVLKATVEEK
jgi:hypothetical protein